MASAQPAQPAELWHLSSCVRTPLGDTAHGVATFRHQAQGSPMATPEQQPSNSGPAPNPADRLKPYQWKPGQSGNPGGRPKHESLTATLRRKLQEEHHGKPLQAILVERLLQEALSVKYQFIRELFDRLEGRPNQRVEVAGEGHGIAFVREPLIITEDQVKDLPPHTKVIRGVDPDAL